MAFETEAEKKPYKWVKKTIESSDPYKDYVKIWRLSIEYTGGGDFIQNLIYATTFSNFIASEWGSEAVWRNDGGKVLHHATDRVYETQYHNSVWWYHGPHHPETQKSVDTINKRHAYYAKKYPVHRLRLKLHLPGFTEKQMLAAHIFWKEVAHLFLVEVPHRPLEEWKPLSTHEDFPRDWDGMYKYCEDFENQHMATIDKGHMITEALFDQFADRFFPSTLRSVGRSIPITLSLLQTLRAHRIQPTNPILARIIVLLVGTFMWFMETFFLDPKISYQETLQLQLADMDQKKQTRKLGSGFPATFASNHQGAAAFCPFSVSTEKSD
ncbi:hypothetical protein N7507_008832 [Penicillium longicatenatum]|nr:hypothetical protein N7507_008832 [Penicillium longicatenatum]